MNYVKKVIKNYASLLDVLNTWVVKKDALYVKELNNEINSLHERALRLTYQNRYLSFDELLKFDKSLSIHYRNLQCFLTKIYKVKMWLCPPIMNNILNLDPNDSYNLISGVTVTRTDIRTNKFGFETINTIGAVL